MLAKDFVLSNKIHSDLYVIWSEISYLSYSTDLHTSWTYIYMADWGNLPPDLMAQIAKRLPAHDFIVFGAVCKQWQSASHTLKEKPPLSPWLVLAEMEKIDADDLFFCPDCRKWDSAYYLRKEKPLVPSWLMIAEEEKEKVEFNDDIFFCFLCGLWQFPKTYSSNSKEEKSPPLPPWFVPAEDDKVVKDAAPKIRSFFNLSTLKTYDFELPEASGRNCLGASYGCIFTLGYDLQINLLHPFTREQIPLPSMLAFTNQYNYSQDFWPQEVFDTFVRKVVLSSNPWTEKDCIVAAIYGEFRLLAFARIGDTVWTNIQVPSRRYKDIIFYEGKLYAVDGRGNVVVCNNIVDHNGDDGPRATAIATPLPTGTKENFYLVESSGDLLLVSRVREVIFSGDEEDGEVPDEYTVGFSVLKLDEYSSCDIHSEDGQQGSCSTAYPYKWTEVNGLGDEALFLGRNASLSLPASKFNGSLKANCIYFTDDCCDCLLDDESGPDMGIFNMKNGTIEHLYSADNSRHPLFPPFWLIM
ncbi:hypothetical protein ACH5RR_016961 [Cinchona calisaya]|uniref:F-box domain-containing protein n=1 Tax=Cinchona calisaya TaxID=153742 RepID=A0ABD2ZXI8_9GENT